MSTIQDWTQQYMFPVIEPNLQMIQGFGPFVTDIDGRTYLDCDADSNTNLLGHAHPAIMKALEHELAAGMLHCPNSYYHHTRARFAKMLCQESGMTKVFFCNSGTEATETVIKMARRWCNEVAHVPPVIITVEGDFHGRTIAALAASDVPAYYKRGYNIDPHGFVRIPFDDVDALWHQSDYAHVLLMDTIQGNNGDVRPHSALWWDAVCQLQKRGNLLILDEVQTYGFRTGYLWAYDYYGIIPDIVYTAKGLAAGIPCGAVLARGKVCRTFNERSAHYSTFGGNILAMAAGVAQLRYLLDNRQEIADNQAALRANMRWLRNHPAVTAVRGLGSFWATDVAGNAFEVRDMLCELGVLVQCHRPTHIKITPPLILAPQQTDVLVNLISTALNMVDDV